MEYLAISGAVELKVDADQAQVRSLLRKLSDTLFDDNGAFAMGVDGKRLCILAEGTVSESHSTCCVLRQLQEQLTQGSQISISRIRWETVVTLRCASSTPANFRALTALPTLFH